VSALQALSPNPVPPPRGPELLDLIGPLAGAHVLVIGPGALETVCGLIRRGCAAAAEVPDPMRGLPDAEEADAVLVPAVASLTQAWAAVVLAKRVLSMAGRIALRDASFRLGPQLAALLRVQGFCAVRTRKTPEGTVLSGTLPLFGPRLLP